MPSARPVVPAPLLVVGSCVSLQFGAAIATPLLHELGPGLTTALRLLLAALMLLAVHRPVVRAWKAGDWRSVVVFGVVLGAMNGCFYAAIARIPLGVAVTIEFAGPLVLAAVLSRRLRDLGFVVAAAVAIVVLGLDGNTGSDRLDPVGVALALAAALFWALYILAGRSVGRRLAGSGPLAVGMTVGAVAMLPLGLGGVPTLVAHPVALLPLVAVGLLSSFIPYSLEFAAMRRMSATTFGVLLALEPVIAGVAGWLLLGQALGPVTVGAMVLVVAASVGSTLFAARDAARVRQPDAVAPETVPEPIPPHDTTAPPTGAIPVQRAAGATAAGGSAHGTEPPSRGATSPATGPVPVQHPGFQAGAGRDRTAEATECAD